MVIARNVNSKLVERVVATEHRCWENAQYSSRDTLEVVGITMSVRDNVLEQKVCGVFQEIGVDMCNRHIQACHRLKDKDRAIVKFTNRKDCLRILRVKKTIKRSRSCSGGLARWNQNFCQWEFAPLLSRDMEQMYKVKGQTKSAPALPNKRFNSFKNGGTWSGKNYHSYGWPKNLFPDIEIDRL